MGANIDHPLNWLMFGLNGAEMVFKLSAILDSLNLNSKVNMNKMLKIKNKIYYN